MELSIKKINRALTYFIDGKNYQYAPSQFMFDYKSDPDYAYMAVDSVYIIRVPKKDLPEVLKTDLYPMINREAPLEHLITITASSPELREVKLTNWKTIDHKTHKTVAVFTAVNGKQKQEIWINEKFFAQYFNKPITKYGVPNNITFSATPTIKNSPVIMWENDEAIALFLPIKH